MRLVLESMKPGHPLYSMIVVNLIRAYGTGYKEIKDNSMLDYLISNATQVLSGTEFPLSTDDRRLVHQALLEALIV
jgi:hypothetical protein